MNHVQDKKRRVPLLGWPVRAKAGRSADQSGRRPGGHGGGTRMWRRRRSRRGGEGHEGDAEGECSAARAEA
jgi:hypothetical protein